MSALRLPTEANFHTRKLQIIIVVTGQSGNRAIYFKYKKFDLIVF